MKQAADYPPQASRAGWTRKATRERGTAAAAAAAAAGSGDPLCT